MVYVFILFAIPSCKKQENSADSNYKTTLQFAHGSFFVPSYTDSFFEISVNLKSKKFSHVKQLENYSKFENINQSERVKNVIAQTVRSEGRIVNILDVSPDKRWASVLIITQPETTSQHYKAYLIDIDKAAIITIPSASTLQYFSNDSKYCLFNEVLDIKKIELSSGQVTEICEGPTFLMFPTRDKFLVFHKQRIWLSSLDGKERERVGKYSCIARQAGLVNENWGYFTTQTNPKGGKTYLFFINLSNYRITKYPYKFPSSRLIRAIPSDSLPQDTENNEQEK